MKQFGLQLFSIRDYMDGEETIRSSFQTLKEYGYSEVQTAGALQLPPEAFAAAARDAGLSICGTHYPWAKTSLETDDTMRVHEILGTTNIGMGAMPGGAGDSRENLLRFIDQANEVAAKLARNGFKLTYHHHSFEFRRFEDGKTMMDHLIDGFDPDNISFVLDTYWVQHGGYDICKMIRRLKGRIDILHLKDMGACRDLTLSDGSTVSVPYITEIGNGNINFEDIIPLAESTGVKSFIVEQDNGFLDGDSLRSVKVSADYIKANLLK